jgi:hypothetical protein
VNVTKTVDDSITAIFNSNQGVTIGRQWNVGAGLGEFGGAIANVGIWNDVRTDAEMLEDFQKGYTDLGNANLVTFYPLNEGTGTTVDNAQGNATLDGTIIGSAQWFKDEWRPLPSAPTQQTLDISGITFASGDDLYIRSFTQNESGLYTPKVDEITLEYKKAGGGLAIVGVG